VASNVSTWIAQRIREAREARGWTQAELAQRLLKTQTAVSYWEAGKRTPGLDDLLDLSEALGVDVDSFLPPERTRQPVAAILRAEAQRLASRELTAVVDELLDTADELDVPSRDLTISAATPAYAANELLEKAGIFAPPVPVLGLARLCGVLVVEHDFPDALSGILLEVDGGAIVGINENHHERRQRFSLAHELGHHLLGHAGRFHIDLSDTDPPGFDYRSERAANEFAADLLMPRRLVTAWAERDPSTDGLARAFNVSEIAMGYRLVNLGLR
jgi:transcriptional regulator with XRE-family HTH domain